jgi:hypothetical protein
MAGPPPGGRDGAGLILRAGEAVRGRRTKVRETVVVAGRQAGREASRFEWKLVWVEMKERKAGSPTADAEVMELETASSTMRTLGLGGVHIGAAALGSGSWGQRSRTAAAAVRQRGRRRDGTGGGEGW